MTVAATLSTVIYVSVGDRNKVMFSAAHPDTRGMALVGRDKLHDSLKGYVK